MHGATLKKELTLASFYYIIAYHLSRNARFYIVEHCPQVCYCTPESVSQKSCKTCLNISNVYMYVSNWDSRQIKADFTYSTTAVTYVYVN